MAYFRNNQTSNLNQQTIKSNQQNINQALQELQNQQAAKPGQYQSEWQAQINEMLDKIMNREKFSYDLNGDALYQQYKDQYTLQGQQAMMDTMGQAQAMTGGYGNSYAQTVGQQVYQGYLQQLGEKIPELYSMALDQYNQEGQNMLNQYGLMMDQENQDYGRYRDTVSDWQTELDRLMSKYYTERDFGYQQDRDKVADEQWQKQYDEAVRQWQAEFDEAVRQYNEKNSSSSSSSSSSSVDPGGYGGYDNQGYGEDVIKTLQSWLGVTADGKWGASTAAAAAAKGYNSVSEALLGYNKEKNQTPTGFTGSTYSEACAYLKANGISSAGVMTQTEWVRHKNNNNSAGGEHLASTYQEYLASYVYGAMKYKK